MKVYIVTKTVWMRELRTVYKHRTLVSVHITRQAASDLIKVKGAQGVLVTTWQIDEREIDATSADICRAATKEEEKAS